MSKYIDAEKLIAEIERLHKEHSGKYGCDEAGLVLEHLEDFIGSLQQEQPNNMIQWTGNNLKEVIDFTVKSPRFGEWFKSWEEYETYVHTHNDTLKLFFEDGGHYEVPVGAWIIKTPDGYNVPSVAKYIQQEQPEVDLVAEFKHHLATTPKEQPTNEEMLRTLRTQPHWKPSKEQMEHLKRCFSHGMPHLPMPNQHVLESLYNDLKKLI